MNRNRWPTSAEYTVYMVIDNRGYFGMSDKDKKDKTKELSKEEFKEIQGGNFDPSVVAPNNPEPPPSWDDNRDGS